MVLVVPYVAFAIEAPALTEAVLSEKWRGTGPVLAGVVWRRAAAVRNLLARPCIRFVPQAKRRVLTRSIVHRHIDLTHRLPIKIRQCGGRLRGHSAGWRSCTTGYTSWSTFVACGFPLADFRRVCLTGLVAIAGALVFGASDASVAGVGIALAGICLADGDCDPALDQIRAAALI